MVLVMKINIQFFEVSSLIEQKPLRKRKKIAAFDEPRSCSVRD